MHTLPCTTVAGRAAADRRRAELGIITHVQDRAREELDRALRFYGLTTKPHFDEALATDRLLWVECRLSCAEADRKLVFDVLDQEGWQPDAERTSRHRGWYDFLRLRHASTDALLAVIIKIPHGEVTHLEAA